MKQTGLELNLKEWEGHLSRKKGGKVFRKGKLTRMLSGGGGRKEFLGEKEGVQRSSVVSHFIMTLVSQTSLSSQLASFLPLCLG